MLGESWKGESCLLAITSIALSGLSSLQYPTRDSLRSPRAISLRPAGANHLNIDLQVDLEVLQQPRPGVRGIELEYNELTYGLYCEKGEEEWAKSNATRGTMDGGS